MLLKLHTNSVYFGLNLWWLIVPVNVGNTKRAHQFTVMHTVTVK